MVVVVVVVRIRIVVARCVSACHGDKSNYFLKYNIGFMHVLHRNVTIHVTTSI